MEKFNYREEMVDSIKDYLAETDERDYDTLNDELFASDICNNSIDIDNSPEVKAHVLENIDLLKEAWDCLGDKDEILVQHFLNEEWAYFDCIIRIYLLNEVLYQVLTDIGYPPKED